MRRATMPLLVVGLLAGGSAPGLAQDEEAAMAVQRVEVPEAGVALSLPAEWDAYVELREREDWGLYDEGFAEEPVIFWDVIYASHGGRPWCDLVWYPSHPLTKAEHAERYVALMTPSSTDVERAIDVEQVSLPAGEAHRFDIYNEPTATYTTVYLLGMGDSRYLLQCAGDERSEDEWLSVARSLEALAAPGESTDESTEEE